MNENKILFYIENFIFTKLIHKNKKNILVACEKDDSGKHIVICKRLTRKGIIEIKINNAKLRYLSKIFYV